MREPLLKVTLNLFRDDVAELKKRYGYGYSEIIREIVHEAVNASKPTIEDFAEEQVDG